MMIGNLTLGRIIPAQEHEHNAARQGQDAREGRKRIEQERHREDGVVVEVLRRGVDEQRQKGEQKAAQRDAAPELALGLKKPADE